MTALWPKKSEQCRQLELEPRGHGLGLRTVHWTDRRHLIAMCGAEVGPIIHTTEPVTCVRCLGTGRLR